MRQFDRYALNAVVSFEALDKEARAGKGQMRDVSLASGFVESPDPAHLHSWLKVRILAKGQPLLETVGTILRLDDRGFAFHFNWLDRNSLKEFGEILSRHSLGKIPEAGKDKAPDPDSPKEISGNLALTDHQFIDWMFRKSWASFVEKAPPKFLDMMTWWSKETYLAKVSQKTKEILSNTIFIGNSPKIMEVFKKIRLFADTDLPVLLTGETGSGKEVFSRFLHDSSRFREGPFIPVNCGAIPQDLAESLLFGHEKGSFSGAHQAHKGYLEVAEGGTIFLDEIGEFPLSLQAKILRVLQERTFARLGSCQERPLRCRILSATNRNIFKEAQEGTFRKDLYYRLEGVQIEIPSLRERREDQLPLAEFLLKTISAKIGFLPKPFSEAARIAIQTYPWPGNIREMYNCVSRAIINSEYPEILPVDLGIVSKLVSSEPFSMSPTNSRTLRECRESFERNLLLESLMRNNGNISRISGELDVSRPSVYSMLKKYRLEDHVSLRNKKAT